MSSYKRPKIKDKTYSIAYSVNETDVVVLFLSYRSSDGLMEYEEPIKDIVRHNNNVHLLKTNLLIKWKKFHKERNHKIIFLNYPNDI